VQEVKDQNGLLQEQKKEWTEMYDSVVKERAAMVKEHMERVNELCKRINHLESVRFLLIAFLFFH
jgi:hypothetical protein